MAVFGVYSTIATNPKETEMYKIMTWCVIYTFCGKTYTDWNDSTGLYWDEILFDCENLPSKHFCGNYSTINTTQFITDNPLFKTKEIIW